MFKRLVLFLATNIAVLLMISFILKIFNIEPYLSQYGINYQILLTYALMMGFAGSVISLFMSKSSAIRAFNIQLLDNTTSEIDPWLYNKVKQLADQRNIGMPDVGIYRSPEPNAFATGWNKDKALLAISTGLLQGMNQEEVEGVLGHEVSHIANGDMVTLALIQGVVNTFVVFFARVVAFIASGLTRRNSDEQVRVQGGSAYYSAEMLFQFLFGLLASLIVMWFSRHREFRADKGSAEYLGKEKMIKALERLQQMVEKSPVDNRAPSFNTMKISAYSRWLGLFASHPPIEKRIEALQKMEISRKTNI